MSTATEMLAKYLAAESALLEGKEVTLGDRRLRFEDLVEVRAGRKEWEERVARESNRRAPSIGGATFSVARLD